MGLERGLINRQIKGRRLLILRTVNVHYIMYIIFKPLQSLQICLHFALNFFIN